MKPLLYTLVMMLLLGACESDLPLPGASSDHKIVLLGELTAGDTMLLRAGQSTSLNSGGTGPGLPEHLSLALTDKSGGHTILTEREDSRSSFLYTLPFTSPEMIQAGHSYTAAASHPQLGEAGAVVSIPEAFSASLNSSSFVIYNNDSVLSIDIDITNPATPAAQYVIEVIRQPVAIDGYFYFDFSRYAIRDNRNLYDSLKAAGVPLTEDYDTTYSGIYSRQPFYTTDLRTDNGPGAGQGRLFRRLFLQAKSFSGSGHHTQILIPRKDIYGEAGQHAQITVYVKSVAAEYYTFLKSYEAYDPYSGPNGNGSPSQLSGNITGGFGMIGGVYRQTFYFLF